MKKVIIILFCHIAIFAQEFNAPYFEQEHYIDINKASLETPSNSNSYKATTRIGGRIAISSQNVKLKTDSEEDEFSGFGIPFGFVLSIPISDKITFDPGLQFHSRSFEASSIKYKESAMSIPLAFRFTSSPLILDYPIYAEAGTQLDIPFSTEYTKFEDENYDGSYNKTFFDFGFIFGFGVSYNIGSNVLLLGYRYIANSTLTQHQIGTSLLFDPWSSDKQTNSKYDNFNGFDRTMSCIFNLFVPGIGSIGWMDDWQGAITQWVLYGGGIALILSDVDFGLFLLTTNFAYNIFRSITYDKPSDFAYNNGGFNFGIAPSRNGKGALYGLTYNRSF